MALYENGKRISGIRDFPAYTWDEYHALPAAQRPKVWKCTDRDYTDVLTADDISFDPTVKNVLPASANTVQKAVDAVSDYLKLEDVSASVSLTTACASGSSLKVLKYGKLVHVVGTIIAAANTSVTTIFATGLPNGSAMYGTTYVIVNPSFKNKCYQMGIGIPGSGNAGALRFLYPTQGLVANEDLNIDITYFTD